MKMKSTLAALQCLITVFLFLPECLVAGSSHPVNPCKVINHEEAESIMGEQLKEGEFSEKKVVNMQLCIYDAVSDSSFSMLQISLTHGARAKEIFSGIKENFSDCEMVEGIGDEAFFAAPGMHILTSGYYVSIAAGNSKRNRDKLLAAGQKAVANLKGLLK